MQTSRWPISKLPIRYLEPFHYHKGELYVELLDRLAKYVTDQLHPNLRKTVEEMVEELEHILALQHNKYVEGVQDFQRIHDAFMEDVNSALMALNDNAVADLVEDPGSDAGKKLRELFASSWHQDTSVNTVPHSAYGVLDGDVASLQHALNTMPEHHVLTIPQDFRFNTTEPIRVTRSVGIRGGTYHGPGNIMYVTGKTTVFEDMTFIGTGSSDADHDDTARALYVLGSADERVRTRISRVEVYDMSYRGINVVWGEHCIIEDCTVHHFRYVGIAYGSTIHSVVRRNDIRYAHADASVNHNSYGITVSNSTSGGRMAICQHIEVAYNYIESIPHWEGIDTHNGQYLNIHNNTVIGARRGIAIVHNMTDEGTTPKGTRVVNNIVDYAGASMDIHNDSIGISTSWGNDRNGDAVVTGNIVRGGFKTPINVRPYQPWNYDYTKLIVNNNQVDEVSGRLMSTTYDTGWSLVDDGELVSWASGYSSSSDYPLMYKIVADEAGWTTYIRGTIIREEPTTPGYDLLFRINQGKRYLVPESSAFQGNQEEHIIGYIRGVGRDDGNAMLFIAEDRRVHYRNRQGSLPGNMFLDATIVSKKRNIE